MYDIDKTADDSYNVDHNHNRFAQMLRPFDIGFICPLVVARLRGKMCIKVLMHIFMVNG